MIYLDNSATTRIDEQVLDSMLPWLRDGYGNASSIYSLGRAARVAVEDARMEIAALIGAHPAEITFTSGGTESNNTILKSCCGPSHLATDVHVGSTEHHAILHPAEYLRASGIGHRLLEVDQTGRLLLEGLASSNTPTTLVSVMHANNETGVVHDVSALRHAIPDALLHSDAVQSFGKIPVNVGSMGVDFLSLSAHKIHGPKGVGAMFIRKGIDFKSHQQGGGQERNRRAGTEPVALIVGFAMAARRAAQAMEERTTHMISLITEARRAVVESIPNIHINTPEDGALPNILNISFRDAATLDGEAILQTMDMEGIAVSNGSACVSGSLQPSHVLLAMGLPPSEAKAAVRISVSKDTTPQEIGTAVTLLSKIIRGLRV